ncbi:MAG TPA: RHS repeat-associated core domain-containing protein [Clostridia bacterium]|nr:RHS repeat-associated core domain-containing protein [Clostridia bacterium]
MPQVREANLGFHGYDALAHQYDELCSMFISVVFAGCNSTGKERDSETGLDYFGARYYGSNTGRFMTPDPHSVQSVGLGTVCSRCNAS